MKVAYNDRNSHMNLLESDLAKLYSEKEDLE